MKVRHTPPKTTSSEWPVKDPKRVARAKSLVTADRLAALRGQKKASTDR